MSVSATEDRRGGRWRQVGRWLLTAVSIFAIAGALSCLELYRDPESALENLPLMILYFFGLGYAALALKLIAMVRVQQILNWNRKGSVPPQSPRILLMLGAFFLDLALINEPLKDSLHDRPMSFDTWSDPLFWAWAIPGTTIMVMSVTFVNLITDELRVLHENSRAHPAEDAMEVINLLITIFAWVIQGGIILIGAYLFPALGPHPFWETAVIIGINAWTLSRLVSLDLKFEYMYRAGRAFAYVEDVLGVRVGGKAGQHYRRIKSSKSFHRLYNTSVILAMASTLIAFRAADASKTGAMAFLMSISAIVAVVSGTLGGTALTHLMIRLTGFRNT